MTARWVVEVVQPERDLTITWQPISLLFKNQPEPDSEYYAPVVQTHNLLRVMESVRADLGDDAAFSFYWEAGRTVHHDQELGKPAAAILEAAGLSAEHAGAYDDEKWDAEIRTRMDQGLALVGNDVGTPIIAFDNDGEKLGIFGPVISRVPRGDDGLKLWDAMVTMSTMPMFWELKRTRTEGPQFGDRP